MASIIPAGVSQEEGKMAKNEYASAVMKREEMSDDDTYLNAEGFATGFLMLAPINLLAATFILIFSPSFFFENELLLSYIIATSISASIIGASALTHLHRVREEYTQVVGSRKGAMQCFVCGALISSDALSCQICGSTLLKRCMSCGTIIGYSAGTCTACGAKQ